MQLVVGLSAMAYMGRTFSYPTHQGRACYARCRWRQKLGEAFWRCMEQMSKKYQGELVRLSVKRGEETSYKKEESSTPVSPFLLLRHSSAKKRTVLRRSCRALRMWFIQCKQYLRRCTYVHHCYNLLCVFSDLCIAMSTASIAWYNLFSCRRGATTCTHSGVPR